MFIMCYLGSCIMSFLLQFSMGDPISKFSIFTRSKCKQCQKTLQWWMVLPIWSYIFLRGKCHYCQKAIPKYLWVGECLGSVVSFFILSRHFEIYWFYLYFLILVFLSLGLIDIQYFIVPHRLLALLLLLTLVLMPQFLKFSLAKLLLISILFLIGILFQRFIGFGDIKLFIIISFIFPMHFSIYVIWLTFPIALLTYPIFYFGFHYKNTIPLVPSIVIAFSIVAYMYPVLNIWFGGL